MINLPWHHLHITIEDPESASLWHEQFTSAKRGTPTKRSENLMYGPNLMQFQSKAVAPVPNNARLESIGLSVSSLNDMITTWQSAGAIVNSRTDDIALVQDPWGIPFEIVENAEIGYSHINIVADDPEQLLNWYESNLGGNRITCEWDNTRTGLSYDSMKIIFISATTPVEPTNERFIDHLGWYTENLEAIFQQLSENGVKFPVKPREFGLVRLAFAEDPCGIWIELLESPDGIIKKGMT